MKKIIMILVLSLILIGCNTNKSDDNTLNIGVAFYPMKDILLLIEDDLKAEGIKLNIHEFTDYQSVNNLLKDKELDANMIQHQYFLEKFNEANNSDLEVILPIYHATFALYSKDYTSLEDIEEGSTITLPDDDTNLSRALYLLNQSGLIEVDMSNPTNLTLDDIISNPKNLDFSDQVSLTSLAQRYTETKLAIMYPTYAKSLELVGNEQRLYTEKADEITNGYAISLVSRSDNKDSENIKTLIKLLSSDKVREFLIENYNWASTPAF